MKIIINKELCNGCGNCYEICPNDAIDFDENDIAFITEKCNECLKCIDACTQKAIIIKQSSETLKGNLDEYRGVWVYVEHENMRIPNVVLELLGIGKKLASKLSVDLSAIVLGNNIKNITEILFNYGADKIYLIEDKLLQDYKTISYTNSLEFLINKYKPEIILFPATCLGRDLAPRLACRLETGLSADCTQLDINKDRNLVQIKPGYNANVYITILTTNHRPQIVTIRPKIFDIPQKVSGKKGVIIEESIDLKESSNWTELLDIIKEAKKTANLEESQVIIAGGKGLGKPENFKLIEEFASCLNAGIGASRVVVDDGWIPHYHQIGQTGKTVKPKIYIACGISGAIQHIIGMRSSDFIIAINKDPDAPIFKVADIGIVADLFEILPVIIRKLKKVTS
ncbi:MAG: FAD-binding protein [Candidatus Helarchaeota archaeon]